MGLSPDVLFNAVYSDVPGGDVPFLKGLPIPGVSYRNFACSYLLHSVVRKWIPSDTTKADKAALSSFVSANNRCKDWKIPSMDWEVDRVVVGEIQRIISDFLHPSGMPLVSSLYELNEFARPGPGAAVGAIGTSYYTKFFCSSLSSTSVYLYEMYRHYCARVPQLSEAECQRYDSYGSPSIVSGSRCSFVPKTNSISRMICVEPLLNSYYQLGLAHLLEARLRQSFGIDLKTQPLVNHRLAKVGSIDGSLATIDLSAASDSISLGLCQMLLPGWFFELLVQLRSRTTKIDGEEVPLFMMSTMGNGFTFPLQTLIFSAIVKACTSVFLNPSIAPTWSCFGDDLICRREIYDRVVHYLNMLGFSVNASKSFSEGAFRESCGADWFNGQPVRPVFIRKLDSPQDILVAINQFNNWSAYTGIPLRNTIRLLYSKLEKRFMNAVPFDSALDSGIRLPLAMCTPRFDSNGSFKYKTWDRRPSRLWVYAGRIVSPNRLKALQYNPSGLYCSFLYGELTSSYKTRFSLLSSKLDADYIMVRHDRKMYQLKPRCSPYWDHIPLSSLINGVRLGWQQWETAVLVNFGAFG